MAYLRTGHCSKYKTPEAGRNVECVRDRRRNKIRVAGEEIWEARSESRSGVWGLHGRGLRPASEQDSHEEVLCGETGHTQRWCKGPRGTTVIRGQARACPNVSLGTHESSGERACVSLCAYMWVPACL